VHIREVTPLFGRMTPKGKTKVLGHLIDDKLQQNEARPQIINWTKNILFDFLKEIAIYLQK
jgi:hypothetical protein